MGAILSNRELGRATLARQLLLERSELAPVAALEHLVGLQSQTAQSWYTGLWSRLASFDPIAFGSLLEQRAVVRIALMRSTVHLVTADDALFLRPLVQPIIDRSTLGAFRRFWHDLDLDAVADEGERLMAEAPLTSAQLGSGLQQRWPDRDRLALAQAVRMKRALVQVPPRGVWRKAGQTRLVTIESWLGRQLEAAPSIDLMVQRYLAAFGPATVMDVQAWCGRTKLGEVLERLRPTLAVFRDGAGRELFDLPDAPRPPADIPAPVRYLYDFDNILLSHADRSRITDYDFFDPGWMVDGSQPSCVLIDGRVAATWLLSGKKHERVLQVRTLSTRRGDEIAALEQEGQALLRFLEPDGTGEVRVGVV